MTESKSLPIVILEEQGKAVSVDVGTKQSISSIVSLSLVSVK